MFKKPCFCLIVGLVICINADSITNNDASTNASEESKAKDANSNAKDTTDEPKGDTPSETGTRSLFSGFGRRSRFGGFARPPMFPLSPFYNELDSSYYGNSRYGNEDADFRRYPGMYDEQYSGAYGRYGMMGQYGDGSFYPGDSRGRYPQMAYNQQPPASSYYTNRPLGETTAQTPEYYRGQPTMQGTPYDRNQVESSNVPPQRLAVQTTPPYDRNQPQQFASPSTPYYEDQRQGTNLPPQTTSYTQDQRRGPTNVQGYRDQQTNSNIRPATANDRYGIPQSVVVVPAAASTSNRTQRTDFAVQPQSATVPVRDQRTETTPGSITTTTPVSSDNRTQRIESNV